MEIFIEFGRKNIRIIMLEEAPSEDSVSAILLSHFQKNNPVYNFDSIIAKKIARVARFEQFQAASIQCPQPLAWSSLSWLAFSSLSPPSTSYGDS